MLKIVGCDLSKLMSQWLIGKVERRGLLWTKR